VSQLTPLPVFFLPGGSSLPPVALPQVLRCSSVSVFSVASAEEVPVTAGKKRGREEKESDTEKQENMEVVKEAGEDAKPAAAEEPAAAVEPGEDAKPAATEEPGEDAKTAVTEPKTPVEQEPEENAKNGTNPSDSVPNSQEEEPIATQLYEGCARCGSICARTLSE